MAGCWRTESVSVFFRSLFPLGLDFRRRATSRLCSRRTVSSSGPAGREALIAFAGVEQGLVGLEHTWTGLVMNPVGFLSPQSLEGCAGELPCARQLQFIPICGPCICVHQLENELSNGFEPSDAGSSIPGAPCPGPGGALSTLPVLATWRRKGQPGLPCLPPLPSRWARVW